jgi:mRNA interferase MazF
VIPGKIVLTKLLQSDGQIKPRPALILKAMPPYGDFLVCGISSKLYQEATGFDEIISIEDQDFIESRLKQTSLIRLGWLETIPANTIKGITGTVSTQRLNRLVSRLSSYIAD